jgi:predicted metalloprotease with PDZ domain
MKLPGKLNGRFSGFRTAGGEIDAAAIAAIQTKIWRGKREESGGELFRCLGLKLAGVRERDLSGLRGHGGSDFLNAVSNADHGSLACSIQIAPSVGGDNPGAFATDSSGKTPAKASRKDCGVAGHRDWADCIRCYRGEILARTVLLDWQVCGNEECVTLARNFEGVFMRVFGAKAAFVAGIIFLSGGTATRGQEKQPVKLEVDLRDATKRVYHSKMEFPVSAGPLTLVYPKWIPGEHSPTEAIVDATGLYFRGNGKEISWRRDEVDLFAFHCEIPSGVERLEVTLDYLLPTEAGTGGPPSATARLAVLPWNLVVLYPAGAKSDEVMIAPNLRVPEGWTFATALQPRHRNKPSNGEVEFETVSLTRLVDSPLLAGAFLKTYDLSPGAKPEHRLNIAADSAAATAMTPEELQHMRQLVAETGALFGARHYRHYDFLLALTDHLETNGLEHHESSDNRAPERMWLDADTLETLVDLLPHEFFHSWNGKYRRPAGLATENYQAPMKGDLLWVYEGLTQYYGVMLAARSGFWTPAQLRETLAATAAYLNERPGRTWRDLEDTAISAQLLYGARAAGSSWRRSADYYDESTLIWLKADTIIRRKTKGQRSLDDFCRRFYGAEDGAIKVVPYTLDDIVAAMNATAPYDWKKFFEDLIHSHGPGAPLEGLENSGWKLTYSEVMNEHQRADEDSNRVVNVSFSLGFSVHAPGSDDANTIVDVAPHSPAANAGIAPGMRLVAVNGRRWSAETLREAISGAKNTKDPIELLIENEDYFHEYRVDYHGGERYPHLTATSGADVLSEIAQRRAAEVRPAK